MPNNSGFSSFSSLDIQIMVLFLFRDSIKAETEKSNAHEQFLQILYILRTRKWRFMLFWHNCWALKKLSSPQVFPSEAWSISQRVSRAVAASRGEGASSASTHQDTRKGWYIFIGFFLISQDLLALKIGSGKKLIFTVQEIIGVAKTSFAIFLLFGTAWLAGRFLEVIHCRGWGTNNF